jgi:hypothetical protein
MRSVGADWLLNKTEYEMKRLSILISLSAVLVFAGAALAHDEFRVIGTLLKHESSRIEVQKRDGSTVAIKIDQQTTITRDNKPAAPADLAAGQGIVVDALGDSEADLLALEIRIVPPIAH